jgi:two-component system, chemotaxis family, protein-glutamate methylesterase/glutaminase
MTMPYNGLIVDDAATMRVIVASVLDACPEFEVVGSVENGRKALEVLPLHPDLKLILLDIEMPEMDGVEFLRHAKMKSRAKVVILSSIAGLGSPHAAKARSLGADAIVTKPSGAVSFDLAQKRGSELVVRFTQIGDTFGTVAPIRHGRA